jgi:hypothetical protein
MTRTSRYLQSALYFNCSPGIVLSHQLVAFVERKLEQHGIEKIVPNNEELAQAYRLFVRSQEAEHIIERELEQLDSNDAVKVPPDLENRVREYLMLKPGRRDAAVQYPEWRHIKSRRTRNSAT